MKALKKWWIVSLISAIVYVFILMIFVANNSYKLLKYNGIPLLIIDVIYIIIISEHNVEYLSECSNKTRANLLDFAIVISSELLGALINTFFQMLLNLIDDSSILLLCIKLFALGSISPTLIYLLSTHINRKFYKKQYELVDSEDQQNIISKNNIEYKDKDEILFCRKCGYKLETNSQYCSKCGTKVER